MGLANLGAGAGTDVGVAKGRIEIDLTQFRQAQNQMMQMSRQMENAIISMGVAADRSTARQVTSWQRVNAAVEGMLGPLSLAAGFVTAIGVRGSNEVKRLEIAFRNMAGGTEQANIYMSELEELTGVIGVNILDMQDAALALLPATRRAGAELSDMIVLAQRLMILNPYKDYGDAARAMSELLAGQTISIVNQFNLQRSAINKIVDDAKGDNIALLQGLSEYLDSVGATNEALEEMGASGVMAGRNMRQEWKLTLAQGFEPVAAGVNRIQGHFAEMARTLRTNNAELVKTVALMTALVAAGGGVAGLKTMPLVGQMIPVSPGLARGARNLGVYGAAAYGGATIGRELVQWAGGLRGDERMQNYQLGDAVDTFKQALVLATNTVVIFVKGILRLVDMFQEFLLNLAPFLSDIPDKLREAGAVLVEGIWDVAYWISEQLGKIGIDIGVPKREEGARAGTVQEAQAAVTQMMREFFIQQAGGYPGKVSGAQWAFANQMPDELFKPLTAGLGFLARASDDAGDSAQDTRDWVDKTSDALDGLVIKLGQATGVIKESEAAVHPWVRALQRSMEADTGDTGRLFGITDEMLDGYAAYLDDLEEIDRQGQERRLSMEEAYQQTLTREMEDEQVRRRRAEEDLARAIADVQQSLAETVAEATASYNERVSEINETFQKEEAQRLQDHQRDLERMEREHRNNLLSAAARLDAVAVWQEMQNYNESRRNAEEDFEEETQQRQEQLQERLDQEKEAHEERLAEARKAAARRIQQLQEEFARSERLYAEDRARRLARQAEDYASQLRDLNKSIVDQRTARSKAYIAELQSAQNQAMKMLGIANKEYDALYQSFVAYLARMKAAQVASNVVSAVSRIFGTGRQGGGEVYNTAYRMTEAGEFVMRSDTARLMRGAVGAPLTQGKMVDLLNRAQMSSGGSKTIQIGDIIIQGGRGDPRQIARAVREELAMIIG